MNSERETSQSGPECPHPELSAITAINSYPEIRTENVVVVLEVVVFCTTCKTPFHFKGVPTEPFREDQPTADYYGTKLVAPIAMGPVFGGSVPMAGASAVQKPALHLVKPPKDVA